MKEIIKSSNDGFDSTEEYFRKKDKSYENETEEYFPEETSTPPHY